MSTLASMQIDASAKLRELSLTAKGLAVKVTRSRFAFLLSPLASRWQGCALFLFTNSYLNVNPAKRASRKRRKPCG